MKRVQRLAFAFSFVFAAFNFTACNKTEVAPVASQEEPAKREAVTEQNCTAELTSARGIQLGYFPKLAPVASGLADNDNQNECDYFIAFNNNDYPRVVVADQGDAEAANQIRSLINDAPQFLWGTQQIIGGGFGGTLALSRRATFQSTTDTRLFVVFGATRTNNYLSSMASRKGTDVRSLLAKHVRMGYWN
jgi:hypothetical protein